MTLHTSDFDYPLDPSLIAQKPADRREGSRLMRLSRAGGGVTDHTFSELPDLLTEGDLLVVNDTRVIPARFHLRRASGGRIEGLFLRELGTGLWEVMLKGASRCRGGERLDVEGQAAGRCEVVLTEKGHQGRWQLRLEPPRGAVELLEQVGQTPLPPYIRRKQGDEPGDRERYQTIYADRPGAVAAPTAGLHFTDSILKALADKGIERTQVTLHVGVGTFAPVKVQALGQHRMHAEWYELSAASADRINAARTAGRRVVAVGTTSVRVLETVATGREAPLSPRSGWTDIFLYPPAEFHATDALITNFHLPKSTLVMLVAAFCRPGSTEGRAMILDAYQQAALRGYRFYSYGDAMLIE